MTAGTPLPLAQLQPAPWNPRGTVDDAALAELVESILQHGVLTPLLVRQAESDRFEIVAGHRRARAAQLADLEEVPCIVRDLSEEQAREIAIVDNLQRADIAPLDEARSFQALLDFANNRHTAASIAARVGKPERYVWDRLRLLDLVPTAQQLLARGKFSVEHAIVLAKLRPEDQGRFIEPDYVKQKTSVWDVEHDLLFDGDDDAARVTDPWWDLKAVTVRELQGRIAKYTRFEPAQAAQANPFDFGPVAELVQQAEAEKKRGRKVVQITFDHYIDPSARSTERTFCAQSWKRADGLEGSKTCDRSVLGVVVVGPGQGQAFPVCINKDCDTHWAKERRAAEKRRQQMGAAAEPGAGGREALRREEERRRKEQEREEALRKAWQQERDQVVAAFVRHLGAPVVDEAFVRRVFNPYEIDGVKKTFGVALTNKTAPVVLALRNISTWSRDEFERGAKAWGFVMPKPGATVPEKHPSATTPAKTAKTAKPAPQAKAAKKVAGKPSATKKTVRPKGKA